MSANVKKIDATKDVAAIVTFHREGILAHTTLHSIERCRQYAEKHGISVELVVTLDNSDDGTLRIVRNHPILREDDQIHEVGFRDLSSCRNFAISMTNAQYIGTFDGDDYFSKNWIERCVSLIRQNGENNIYHPHLIVAFGGWNAYFWQIDQLEEYYRPGTLLTMNYWNACAFAAKSIFEKFPYHISRVGEAGYGFEDWHWNCEIIAGGYFHRVAKETARYERRKEGGSLNVAHQQAGATIPPTDFFNGLKYV